jgi:tRNA threonylcarbamoyladenosine biosynthesis protein TsaB
VILALETATKNCSVALFDKKRLLVYKEEHGDRFVHGERLHLIIQEVLTGGGIQARELEAVCISRGPGSYTGLRIGTSAAKGISFALNVPLLSVATLGCFDFSSIATDWAISVLDARRDEVFAQVWRRVEGLWQPFEPVHNEIVTPNSWSSIIDQGPVTIFGDCSNKVKSLMEGVSGLYFLDDMMPSAQFMGNWLENALKEPEDVAYFEPYYLKDFVAEKSKKKLL